MCPKQLNRFVFFFLSFFVCSDTVVNRLCVIATNLLLLLWVNSVSYSIEQANLFSCLPVVGICSGASRLQNWEHSAETLSNALQCVAFSTLTPTISTDLQLFQSYVDLISILHGDLMITYGWIPVEDIPSAGLGFRVLGLKLLLPKKKLAEWSLRKWKDARKLLAWIHRKAQRKHKMVRKPRVSSMYVFGIVGLGLGECKCNSNRVS